MGLVYLKQLNQNTRFAIWKIEESAEELLSYLQLNPSEKAFLSRINKGKRTLNWLGTRVLLRKMLDTPGYIDCPSDEHGKPFLVNFPLKVSLSHSFDYAAVMLGDREVGIDMELIKPKIEVIARKFMKEDELSPIAASAANYIEKLYVCWCAKEAVYKLQGNKGVSFKDQMTIEPFDYNDQGGSIFLRLNSPGRSGLFQVCYERFGDFMLGYVVE